MVVVASNRGILDGCTMKLYIVDYILQDRYRDYIACVFYSPVKDACQQSALVAHVDAARRVCMRDMNFGLTSVILCVYGTDKPSVFASSPVAQAL